MRHIGRREFLKTLVISTGAALVGCDLVHKREVWYEEGHYHAARRPVPASIKPRPFKFAHITDTHLSTTGRNGAALKAESVKILEDVLDQVNSMRDLDFILFGGDNWDNSDKGTPDADKFLDMIEGLKVPYFVQLGNREVDPIPSGDPTTKEDFPKMFKRHGFSKGRFWWDISPLDGVLIIGMDTSIRWHTDGAIPEEEINWLKEELEGHRGEFIIVLTHHLFLPTWAPKNIPEWDKYYLIANARQVIPILEESQDVKLVLSGHHHAAKIDVVNGLPYIASPATVQYPCAFRIISVDGDKVKLKFHQIRDEKTTDVGRELLIKEKTEEYGPGGAEDVAAYCLGRVEDRETTLIVR